MNKVFPEPVHGADRERVVPSFRPKNTTMTRAHGSKKTAKFNPNASLGTSARAGNLRFSLTVALEGLGNFRKLTAGSVSSGLFARSASGAEPGWDEGGSSCEASHFRLFPFDTG